MTERLEIPRFGELLAPVLERLSAGSVPALLAGLERSAADRYRRWAEDSAEPEKARALLACAAREEEIANRVEKLFPPSSAEREQIDALLPEARQVFLAVFDPHPLADQYRIQADAELQGAAAWRSLASSQTDPAVREELLACAELEEASSASLHDLLSGRD